MIGVWRGESRTIEEAGQPDPGTTFGPLHVAETEKSLPVARAPVHRVAIGAAVVVIVRVVPRNAQVHFLSGHEDVWVRRDDQATGLGVLDEE